MPRVVPRVVLRCAALGQVDTDFFILDYNPTVVSALQAFAICLTTFEKKYLL